MLFNSYVFIFAFLPAVLLGYFLIGALRQQWAATWLVCASLLFYGYWDGRYLILLLISAVINFLFSQALTGTERGTSPRLVLALSIGFNLFLLGYFKYTNFFVANLQAISSLDIAFRKVVLPLGISFFTFTQIAFLVDVYRGQAREPRFSHYLLFVTYFPHLIAGPILHHKEMMPQFARATTYKFHPGNLTTGFAIFIIGLFKKTVLADGVAPYATKAFDAAAVGQHFLFRDAWAGALAYTFQLYFDFSGYCDMAIGVSLMFGITLPLNFNSPYKSLNIIDFWRRWHMTLSRFLRDYLYFPMGGNRKGGTRRFLNLFVTMLLGGLWHGAGWTFIIWGALHGFFLGVNHAFRLARTRLGIEFHSPAALAASWLVTFLAVVIAWVFFRADSLDSALRILEGMTYMSPTSSVVFLPEGSAAFAWVWCIGLLAAALCAPNTQELMHDRLDSTARSERPASLFGRPLTFQVTKGWAIATGAVFSLGLVCLPQPTSFLYFNF